VGLGEIEGLRRSTLSEVAAGRAVLLLVRGSLAFPVPLSSRKDRLFVRGYAFDECVSALALDLLELLGQRDVFASLSRVGLIACSAQRRIDYTRRHLPRGAPLSVVFVGGCGWRWAAIEGSVTPAAFRDSAVPPGPVFAGRPLPPEVIAGGKLAAGRFFGVRS